MKISNYEGEAAAAAAAQDSLGQFRVALRPEFAARAAAIEARGELLQRATPAAMGPIAAQMLARQQQAQANAEAAVAQQEQDAGFDWTNPWFLGGVAAVTLGGVWFWMRRR